MHPGGSVKDRIGVTMLEAAEKAGKITPDRTLEPEGNRPAGSRRVRSTSGKSCYTVGQARAEDWLYQPTTMTTEETRTDARRRAVRLLVSSRHIFIIYSNSDLSQCRDLRRRITRLRRESSDENVFLATESLAPGDDVSRSQIAEKLAGSDLAVVACGERTASSTFVDEEVRQALEQRKQERTQILPIILKVGVKLPAGLDYSIHAVHLTTLFPSIRRVRVGIAATLVVLALTAGLFQLQSSRARLAAQDQVARQLWTDAAVARDERGDLLTAAHQFARAADMHLAGLSADNARAAVDDAIGGVHLQAVLQHDSAVTGASFDGKDERILSRSENGSVRLWSVVNGQPIGRVIRAGRFLSGAIFDPTEHRILTWISDGGLQLWDANTQQPIGAVMKHAGSVLGAIFDHRGGIISWAKDNEVRRWDVTTQAAIGLPMNHLTTSRRERGLAAFLDLALLHWTALRSTRRKNGLPPGARAAELSLCGIPKPKNRSAR